MIIQKGFQFRTDLLLPVVTTLVITLLAFYVDERKYNFDGIFQPENLFFLMVYAALFFGFQQLVKTGLEHFIGTGKSRRIISGALAALSLPLAITMFLWIVKPA